MVSRSSGRSRAEHEGDLRLHPRLQQPSRGDSPHRRHRHVGEQHAEVWLMTPSCSCTAREVSPIFAPTAAGLPEPLPINVVRHRPLQVAVRDQGRTASQGRPVRAASMSSEAAASIWACGVVATGLSILP